MSVNGIHNRPQVPVTELPRAAETPLVHSASVPPSGGHLLSTTNHNATPGDIPGPGGYAPSLDALQLQLEELTRLREQLSQLASRGDQPAQEMLAEIDTAIASLESEIQASEQRLAMDTDGDGVADFQDPDIDGDRIMNELEMREGTDPYRTDTDGDGITDDFERIIHNLGRETGDTELERLGNALDADANGNGIIDSAELPSEVRAEIGMAEEGSDGGWEGVQNQSEGGSAEIPPDQSPFEGQELPEGEERDGVTEYTFEISEASATFQMQETVKGEEAKQWTIARSSNDLIVEAKNRSGDVLARYRLENGFSHRDALEFLLDDIGQRVDTSVGNLTIRGGTGDDMIRGEAGSDSKFYGGDGADMIVVNGSADGTFVAGGDGNDILQGGDGDDRIEGNADNDFIYGGIGNNILAGGLDNDSIFTANTSIGTGTSEVVIGGGGLDMSNAYNGDVRGIRIGIRDLNGLQSYLTQYSGQGASSIQLAEILQMENTDIPYARQLVAEGLESLAINYLYQKDSEFRGRFGPQPDAGPADGQVAFDENGGQDPDYASQPDEDELFSFN